MSEHPLSNLEEEIASTFRPVGRFLCRVLSFGKLRMEDSEKFKKRQIIKRGDNGWLIHEVAAAWIGFVVVMTVLLLIFGPFY